jgi:hypothetical protein
VKVAEFATLLLETRSKAKGFDAKIEVFLNRLLMRIFSQPSLLTYLGDVGVITKNDEKDDKKGKLGSGDDGDVIKTAGEEDDESPVEQNQGETEDQEDKPDDGKHHGAVTIQLDFQKLPEEAIEPLKKLIASPNEVRFFKFIKKGAAHIGLAFDLSPDDMPGEEFDYAH